jgi:hypothetical protein
LTPFPSGTFSDRLAQRIIHDALRHVKHNSTGKFRWAGRNARPYFTEAKAFA